MNWRVFFSGLASIAFAGLIYLLGLITIDLLWLHNVRQNVIRQEQAQQRPNPTTTTTTTTTLPPSEKK